MQVLMPCYTWSLAIALAVGGKKTPPNRYMNLYLEMHLVLLVIG